MEIVEFIFDYLASNRLSLTVSSKAIKNTLALFKQNHTIPFIARYRRTETENLDASTLRVVEEGNNIFNKLRNKVNEVVTKIQNEVSKDYLDRIKHCNSLAELESLYLPFKKGGKGTLAERARKLGLEGTSKKILQSGEYVDINCLINATQEGLRTREEVLAGIQNIIADLIARETEIHERLKSQIEPFHVIITTKKTSSADEIDKKQKYREYYDVCKNINSLQSYQILAINRAEKEKVISVSLTMNNKARNDFIVWMKRQWNRKRNTIIDASIEDSFKRLIEKKFYRKIRTNLSKDAEKKSINVFSDNLKKLLLFAPVRERLISIDPGFRNGCKIAVIDINGGLLDTAVIYPHPPQNQKYQAEKKLKELALRYNISLFVIGNGTACRETESLISLLLKSGKLKGTYSIVNESGASVFSVTDDAKLEFGDLDPNLISAVSIGRRLQDPLLELSKLDPKCLGVGMYQHDVDQKTLSTALEDIIADCVNFIGVDINSCSAHMLKRISGLGLKQSQSIIEYRQKNGFIMNREELKSIKGIGSITFNNCAGFIRIHPQTCSSSSSLIKKEESNSEDSKTGKKRKLKLAACSVGKNKKMKLDGKSKLEPFDQTWIHPESYPLARKILSHLGMNTSTVGSMDLVNVVNQKIGNTEELNKLTDEMKIDQHALTLILDGFKQAAGHDLRKDFQKPIFKSEILSEDQLKVGLHVDGVVRNSTAFGVFVDIGVKNNGLIHKSELGTIRDLGPGDEVECKIIKLELSRNRIGLKLLNRKSRISTSL